MRCALNDLHLSYPDNGFQSDVHVDYEARTFSCYMIYLIQTVVVITVFYTKQW